MKYKFWFLCDHVLSNAKKEKLYDLYRDYHDIYKADEKELRSLHLFDDDTLERFVAERKAFPLEEKLEEAQKADIGFCSIHDGRYPQKLIHIHNAPFQLFYIGRLPAKDERLIGMVGARCCSGYGKSVTISFARNLAKQGYGIVSGMADGIDGISHSACLEEDGQSFGILGCGVDICYPPKNRRIYEKLQKNGGVISEYPPGTTPQPRFFPMRNRIISGLSDVLLVMEAKKKSGSLITASLALEQGRDVYALPGRVTDALSEGCNRLIADGAFVLRTPEDLLRDLDECKNWEQQSLDLFCPQNFNLEKEETLVYSCFDFNAKSIDEIAEMTGIGIPRLTPLIFQLLERGLIEECFLNEYRRV